MNGFKTNQQFTRIKDLSDKRRLPRLGKLRLGVKAVSKRTGKEYPVETKHFVVPPEVQKIYGSDPIELEVMVPVNSLDVSFPTRLIWFGQGKGIKCIGDGEHAMRIEEPDGIRHKEMVERECPCELLDNPEPRLKCSKRASLFVILPKVSVSGVYQIDLSSYNSIVDINSGLSYVEALVGRFAMVPLLLKRVPRETHFEGRKAIHFTLQIFLDATDINFINSLRESTNRILAGPRYALPAPEITNPAMDEEATIVEVEEEPQEEKEPEVGPGFKSGPEQIPPEMEKEEAPVVTVEEEIAVLKERGMIPKEETKSAVPIPNEKATYETDTIRSIIEEVNKCTENKPLLDWFNANSKEWKKKYPKGYGDIMKAVNLRVAELKKK